MSELDLDSVGKQHQSNNSQAGQIAQQDSQGKRRGGVERVHCHVDQSGQHVGQEEDKELVVVDR